MWMGKCGKFWISVDFKERISAVAHEDLKLPSEHKDMSQRKEVDLTTAVQTDQQRGTFDPESKK